MYAIDTLRLWRYFKRDRMKKWVNMNEWASEQVSVSERMSEWLVGRSIARKFYILINCNNKSNTHTFVEAHLNFNLNLYWKFHLSPFLYASLYHQYSHRHIRLRGDCGAVRCARVFFFNFHFFKCCFDYSLWGFFLTAHFSLSLSVSLCAMRIYWYWYVIVLFCLFIYFLGCVRNFKA